MSIENHFQKNHDIFPQKTNDCLRSQKTDLYIPLVLFHCLTYSNLNHTGDGLQVAQKNFAQFFLFRFCENGYQSSFMIVLISK